MRLKNKIAIITGGTRGIGRSIVETFALEGANVFFTYAQNDDLAKEISEGIIKKGGSCHGVKLDVTNFSQIEKWKDEFIKENGRLDILVNNAGIIRDKSLMMMSPHDWKEVIDTNLTGVFNMTKVFIVSFMKEKKGSIINITSVSGIVGLPRQCNYAASKGGLISFTKSLAREVGSFGIRVNAIAPGFTETDMTKSLQAAQRESAHSLIPLARFGKPEEVAKLALFLSTDESGYITGQTIRIDGGLGM